MSVFTKAAEKSKGIFYAAGLITAGVFLYACDPATSSNGGGTVPGDNTVTVTIGGVAKSGTAVAARAGGVTYIAGAVYVPGDYANISTFNIYLKDTVAMEYSLSWSSSANLQSINNLFLQKKSSDTSLYWAIGPSAGKSGSAKIKITKITPYGGPTALGKIQGTFSGTLVNIKDSTDKVIVSGGFNADRYQ